MSNCNTVCNNNILLHVYKRQCILIAQVKKKHSNCAITVFLFDMTFILMSHTWLWVTLNNDQFKYCVMIV